MRPRRRQQPAAVEPTPERLNRREEFNARFPTIADKAEAARLVLRSDTILADGVMAGLVPLWEAYLTVEAAAAFGEELRKRGTPTPETIGEPDDVTRWRRLGQVQNAIETAVRPAIIGLLHAGATKDEAVSILRAHAALIEGKAA